MLLQMSWEKLAKAGLAHTGCLDPMHTHKVVNKLLSLLKRQRSADNEKIWGRNYRSRLDALGQDLAALEALAPAVAKGGDNTEYPWSSKDKAGAATVRWPAAHLIRRFTNPSDRAVVRLLKDFETIREQFAIWFA